MRSRDSYLPTEADALNRALFALGLWLSILVLTVTISLTVSTSIAGLACGVAISLVLIAESLRFVLISVPEYTAVLVINFLKNRQDQEDQYANLLVFTAGLHFKFPWEQVKTENYIDLRVIEQPYDEDFISSDDVPVKYTGTLFFRPSAALLPRHLAFEDTTIKRNLLEILTGYYTAVTESMTAQQCRQHQGLIREGIAPLFAQVGDELSLETYYGIDELKPPTLGDVTYEASYQKAIINRTNVGVARDAARKLKAETDLSDQAAFDIVQVNAGIVKREIRDIRTRTEGSEAVDALMMLMQNIGAGRGDS